MIEATVRESDEFDKPLGGLEGVSRLTLDRTFTEAAVAEVRFVPGRRDLSESDAAAVWAGMGKDAFPIFERQTLDTVSLTVTPSGADQTTQSQQGWVLASADRRSAITLLPSMVVVQTADYARFSTSLGDPLANALNLFTGVTNSSIVQRVGLRYVNRLQDSGATSPEFWQGHVRSSFAGPLQSSFVSNVEAFHQQLQLRLDATAAATVQSGVFREPGLDSRYSFLVDLDVFREQAFGFDEVGCSNVTRQLNRTAVALFAQVLSEEYWTKLGPRLDGEGSE